MMYQYLILVAFGMLLGWSIPRSKPVKALNKAVNDVITMVEARDDLNKQIDIALKENDKSWKGKFTNWRIERGLKKRGLL